MKNKPIPVLTLDQAKTQIKSLRGKVTQFKNIAERALKNEDFWRGNASKFQSSMYDMSKKYKEREDCLHNEIKAHHEAYNHLDKMYKDMSDRYNAAVSAIRFHSDLEQSRRGQIKILESDVETLRKHCDYLQSKYDSSLWAKIKDHFGLK